MRCWKGRTPTCRSTCIMTSLRNGAIYSRLLVGKSIYNTASMYLCYFNWRFLGLKCCVSCRIRWYNSYYQPVVVAKRTQFLLYSAYLDNRIATDVRPCIRILAYSKDTNPTAPWCSIWFNTTGPPAVSRVIRIDYLDWQPRSDDRHMTFLLTCRIPKYNSHLAPLSVSVVSRPCEKSIMTLLKVIGSMERNTTTALVNSSKNKESSPVWNAAVCGPAVSYYHEDVSIQLVEWLELLRALGFARVFLYETDVHPNIEKVLRYYEAEGFVGVTKFAYLVNDPILRK
ncbi:uncharacterized protein LOC119596194 [Penaeus monodon]|uniref:uncharacterized protein LOC119596194 n=1 Tax=Penaeus monodon TaxID=6687 RepID=UPI0018A6D4F8|nr:uncharacterized protein LOC119596194 [Penaeus monodon]